MKPSNSRQCFAILAWEVFFQQALLGWIFAGPDQTATRAERATRNTRLPDETQFLSTVWRTVARHLGVVSIRNLPQLNASTDNTGHPAPTAKLHLTL
jgi:hypothetical protein